MIGRIIRPKNKKKFIRDVLISIIFLALLVTTVSITAYNSVHGSTTDNNGARYWEQINELKSWYQNEYQKEYNDRGNQAFKADLNNYSKEEQDIINSYVNRNYERYINNINEIEKYYKYDEKTFQAYDYNSDKLAFDVEKVKSYKKDNIVNQSITRSNIINEYQQLDTFIFENSHFKKYDYQAPKNKLFITRVLNPRTSFHYETDYAYSFTNLTDENQYIVVRQNDFRLMFEENKIRYPELTNFVYGRPFVQENGVLDMDANDMSNTKWDVDYTSKPYWNNNSHTFVGEEKDWFYQYKKRYVLGSATMGLRWHLLTDDSKYDTFSVVNRTTEDKWNEIFPNSYKWKNHTLASDIIQIKPKEKIYLLAMFNQLPFNSYKVNTNKLYDDNRGWQVQQENMFDVCLCPEQGNYEHPDSNVQSKWGELLDNINYDREKYKNHSEVVQTILNYLEFVKHGFRLLLSPGYKSQFLNIKISPYLGDNGSDFKRNVLVKNKWTMFTLGWPEELKDNVRLYYSFHNINGLYWFYSKVDLQIKNKFKFFVYFDSHENQKPGNVEAVAFTGQWIDIIDIDDGYRIGEKGTSYEYNINFNFYYDMYHKTPLTEQNKLRNKPIYKWEKNEFDYFLTLLDNKKILILNQQIIIMFFIMNMLIS